MLRVEGLSKSFGGVRAIQDVSLHFPAGSLTAVIGPNGAGKTTFFNLVSGQLRPDSGNVELAGESIVGLGRLDIVRMGLCRAFQVASIFPELTVRESLAAIVSVHRGESWRLASRFPSNESHERARELIEIVGLEPAADVRSRYLPHGDQKLLDVAMAIARVPKILLLDEPTAGMGSEERWRMINKIKDLWRDQELTIVFIEHDMDIVFSIAEHIHVLKYGQLLASGTASEIRTNQDVIDAYLGTDHSQVAG